MPPVRMLNWKTKISGKREGETIRCLLRVYQGKKTEVRMLTCKARAWTSQDSFAFAKAWH
eukprot:1144524-Pelagomonas_calceolata.AAC.6